MRVVAGVDCHKSSHTAVFLDAVGQVVDRITFPTTEEGYESALAIGRRAGLHRLGSRRSRLLRVRVQCVRTGARRQGARGARQPDQAHRRHSSHRGKSDETDARAIAEVILREADGCRAFTPACCNGR